jgi:glycosyltransferase involved in cell wall biosynthesis
MKVVHVIESISPHDGGPPNVVLHLAGAQAALGAEVKVVTYRDACNQQWLSDWRREIPSANGIELQEITRGWRFWRSKVEALRGLRDDADIMHVHGIWRSLAWHALSGRHCGRAAILLAPHGMLSPWALDHNGFRKKLAMRGGWRRMISAADVLHAVSLGEQDEIKAVISGACIALIPNGVAGAETEDRTPANIDLRHDGAAAGGYVLYLARLHEMKGPDLLLDAFAEVIKGTDECSGYRLIMAGPDYGEKAALQARAKHLRIEDKVHFPGPVFDKAKWDLYHGATLVCQPSRYEAFSLTLLEAVAAGVPVLTTPEANFPEIRSSAAGIVCRGEPKELARNMRLLLTQPELRERMGRQGRTLAKKYTWERIAMGAMQVYGSLLTGRATSG